MAAWFVYIYRVKQLDMSQTGHSLCSAAVPALDILGNDEHVTYVNRQIPIDCISIQGFPTTNIAMSENS